MKGFLEEYGALMITGITGTVLMSCIYGLIQKGGDFYQMIIRFFHALGMT